MQIAETDHLRGYEIGAVDYVTVPVVPEVLRAKVRVFIELYRKTRQLEAMNAELEKGVAAAHRRTGGPDRAAAPQRERRARSRSRAGDMGSWEVDLATGRDRNGTTAPTASSASTGPRFQPTVEHIEAMMHPEDREKNAARRPAVAAGENRFQVEFRIIRPSGEVRWCYGAGA